MKAKSFEEELNCLLQRYTNGNIISKKKIAIRDQQALPHNLHAVLHSLIGSATERFASPLNVSMTTSRYWSLHKKDTLFGANWNAYSIKWTGASVAVPEHTDSRASTQAVEWALQSAAAAKTPTLTLLVLPGYGKSNGEGGYMKLVQQHHQFCKHLLWLPKSSVNWTLPANALHEKACTGRYNINVIAVGNNAGFHTYLPYWTPGWREEAVSRVRAALHANKNGELPDLNDIMVERQAIWWQSPPQAGQSERAVRDTRKFRKCPLDIEVSKRTTSITGLMQESDDTGRAVQSARNALRNMHSPTPPLQHDWRQFIYTDGSVLPGRPGIGAAVHIPANEELEREAETVAISCKFKDSPQAEVKEEVNTINRAELVAIKVALETAPHSMQPRCHTDRQPAALYTPPATHIATDSLASMYQIWKWVTRPQDMKEHRHLSIIKAIGEEIKRGKGPPVHIWKVKSHIGIVGNEKADKTAVGVAKGTLKDPADQEEGNDSQDAAMEVMCRWEYHHTASNDRGHQYWPYLKFTQTTRTEHKSKGPASMHEPTDVEHSTHHNKRQEAAACNEGGEQDTRKEQKTTETHHPMPKHSEGKEATACDEGSEQGTRKEPKTTVTYHPLPNMAESLKQRTHNICKLGLSNTGTIYYTSWQQLASKMHNKYSHLFMTSSKVTSKQRKRVLQYRYGQLPTYKLLHRYGKAPSSACPLCGGEDGGHHAVSACQALSKAVTLRHNEAGTAILKAISRGCKGNLLVASDVGWRKRHRDGEPTAPAAYNRRMTAQDMPDDMPEQVKQALATRGSIPDAIMCQVDETTQRRHYTLVEVKYCRDTDPTNQQHKAEQQHSQLKETIEEYGANANVDQVTILLGVSGVIYTDTADLLKKKLGIRDTPQLESLLTELHHIAIKSLNSIWEQRGAMIAKRTKHSNTHNSRAHPASRTTKPNSKNDGSQHKRRKLTELPRQGQG
jgi:ribonuclease HI